MPWLIKCQIPNEREVSQWRAENLFRLQRPSSSGCSTQVAGKAHAVVLRGWRAGELLSEERMGRTREACGMLLVQLMGKGVGGTSQATHPVPPIPSVLR